MIAIVIKIFTHPREALAAVIFIELTSWVALSDRHGAIAPTPQARLQNAPSGGV
ncbi:hypothetical protein [Microcoleus sp. B4-D4]|uniref:hypothetical protein n=1 Tax=Microcoleus sp. B4-D4 TaxID=2818667 RepID=UPI002FD5DFBD